MEIRSARIEDRDALAEILSLVLEAFGERVISPRMLDDFLTRALAGEGPDFLVAVVPGVPGTLAGVLSLAIVPTTQRASRFAYVDDLFVRPEHRGRGIASALLAGARDHAVRRGAAELRLAADLGDEGLAALYAQAGFERRADWLVRTLPQATP